GSVEQQYDQLRFYEGIEQVTQLLKRAARTMESAQLMKEPDERKRDSVLCVVFEALRIGSILLSPIVPDSPAHAGEVNF
ncbi:unnamed protein product, partial [Mesorhabditis spiculigera]